jgi:RNA-directed DNA polymerase
LAHKPTPPGKPGDMLTGPHRGQEVELPTGPDIMSTPATGVQEWQDIPWAKLERNVHRLQKRIYRASQRGEVKKVQRLQRLLLSSWSARCLAVRRVTQDNQGKKTPGVDGVAALGPEERLDLVAHLDLDARPQPIRRVWIPKPGTDEQRPLGIPTLSDRARQALVKLALEPEWEARFEPNSYGFRPGRSCHDAVLAIFQSIKQCPKYVLDADIAKCFDRIDHAALLAKLNTFPLLSRLVKGWLKAGVLDGDTLFPTEQGTPQGGVLSPLLANVALHGLETVVQQAFPKTRTVNGKVVEWTPTVVRYADDFVVCHRDLGVIQRCQELIQQWLRGMGLELKPSKTRVGHTLHEHNGRAGLDFLGFSIRQYRVGKYRTGKDTRGRPLGFRTLTRPSKDKVVLHQRRLTEIIRRHRAAPQEALIRHLNPVIKGWCNYYRAAASKQTFHRARHLLFHSLYRWARRRHPDKGQRWIVSKYWRLPQWTFAPPQGTRLYEHDRTRIVRHVQVRGQKSPFDGDWAYWAGRQGHYPGVRLWLALLLKQQKGKCPRCGLYFMPGDLPEVHHQDGEHGNSRRQNLVALHRHCHDAVHRQSTHQPLGSVHDKDCPCEEPYECESLMYGSEDQPGG